MDINLSNISAIVTLITFFLSIPSYYYNHKMLSTILFFPSICFLIIYTMKTKTRKIISIDGVTIHNVKITKKCKTVLPTNIINKCVVNKNKIEYIYTQDGVCIDKKGTDGIWFLFNINDTDINKLNAYSYDLKNDPLKQNKIKASINIINSEYVKCTFNFKNFVGYNNRYYIECHFDKIIEIYPKSYFYSWIAFNSKKLEKYSISIEFIDEIPEYVKIYDSNAVCLKVLDKKQNNNITTYNFVENNCNASNIRIMFFERNTQ